MKVIEAKHISKKYHLGTIAKDSLVDTIKRIFQGKKKGKESFMALEDISFDVKQGEVLGIIGKNGAGKSTLLKVLSRITEPTNGEIKLRGRVASLLEVGTGFHPELSGRENIFLNGAILGMQRKEIKAKFDQIVAFAGVEKFIDTAVKHYSSGMYVRLAFSVAAHLEPEILIIDEVLAVGDAEFQKKCLGKMKDVAKKGRTVLFVSHNMAAVKTLCTRGIVLVNGKMAFEGTAEESVGFYLGGERSYKNKKLFKAKEISNHYFELHEILVHKVGQPEKEIIDEYDEIQIVTKISFFKETDRLHLTYLISNDEGEPLFTFSHNRSFSLREGLNLLICKFPKSYLNIGSYFLSFYIIQDKKKTVYVEKDIFNFQVIHGSRDIGSWTGKEPGFIKPQFQWLNE